MSVKATEWVWDWFKVFWPIDAKDPEGPSDGVFHVIRGCNSNDASENCDLSRRFFRHPSVRSQTVGLRLVRTQP